MVGPVRASQGRRLLRNRGGEQAPFRRVDGIGFAGRGVKKWGAAAPERRGRRSLPGRVRIHRRWVVVRAWLSVRRVAPYDWRLRMRRTMEQHAGIAAGRRDAGPYKGGCALWLRMLKNQIERAGPCVRTSPFSFRLLFSGLLPQIFQSEVRGPAALAADAVFLAKAQQRDDLALPEVEALLPAGFADHAVFGSRHSCVL